MKKFYNMSNERKPAEQAGFLNGFQESKLIPDRCE